MRFRTDCSGLTILLTARTLRASASGPSFTHQSRPVQLSGYVAGLRLQVRQTGFIRTTGPTLGRNRTPHLLKAAAIYSISANLSRGD